jgi:hypothetical protein
MIDADDYESVVAAGIWTAYRPNRKYGSLYVYSTNRNIGALHRFLMQPSSGLVVDHINGDTLDNRRENLRICTHVENLRKAKVSVRNRTGVKGVSHHRGGYYAKLSNTYLGYFPTIEQAAAARREAEEARWLTNRVAA